MPSWPRCLKVAVIIRPLSASIEIFKYQMKASAITMSDYRITKYQKNVK